MAPHGLRILVIVTFLEQILKVPSMTFIPLEIILMFGRSIFQLKTVCLVHEWLLSLVSCYGFSPLDKSATLNSFQFLSEKFGWVCISSQDGVSHAKM